MKFIHFCVVFILLQSSISITKINCFTTPEPRTTIVTTPRLPTTTTNTDIPNANPTNPTSTTTEKPKSTTDTPTTKVTQSITTTKKTTGAQTTTTKPTTAKVTDNQTTKIKTITEKPLIKPKIKKSNSSDAAPSKSSYQEKGNVLISILTSVVAIGISQIL